MNGEDEQLVKHHPYVAESENLAELSWRAIILGVLLGVLFGASSLYLLLKVGMSVSASVPIAVLSITVFRGLSRAVGTRRATILENNIVQTAGSAGESLAFGVGVTMPALYLLGYEMDTVRVMMVSVLGGLLGILMMIPLRRAFIVKQHGRLAYPEGTACAEVLIAGETGGSSAKMVFAGFGIAFVYKFLSKACKIWAEEPSQNLYTVTSEGSKVGLKGAAISGELSPELLGVGYIIGPKIASLMMSGAVLSYFVIGPLIATFGENLSVAVAPAVATGGPLDSDPGLIRNMGPDDIKGNYLRFIGAGAVAAGGIIGMFRSLPLIFASVMAGVRDLRSSQGQSNRKRTEQDIPFAWVGFGSVGLIALLMIVPSLGFGVNFQGFLGAAMVMFFGFLFVTVSSRLTGEVGSSSNPISGMTIATLLMTCLIFWILGRTGPTAMLTALTVAAVVCIASSNGGTTSQDLKTGFLVGATPSRQQIAILAGTLFSAIIIGMTLLALNAAGTHYTTKKLPASVLKIPSDSPRERPGRPHQSDSNEYHIVHVRKADELNPGVAAGRYLVDDQGTIKYRTDLPIDRREQVMDDGAEAPEGFDAPQPQLFTSIIEGILGGTLEWGLIVIGVLIAICVEFAGISALPFAVGMYIPLGATTPIFIGGLVKWLADRLQRKTDSAEQSSDASSGVLLSSGYIAGGTLCGLMLAFMAFLPSRYSQWLAVGQAFWDNNPDLAANAPQALAVIAFLGLSAILIYVSQSNPNTNGASSQPDPRK
jgi:putative OPT family oligopeptide transporter